MISSLTKLELSTCWTLGVCVSLLATSCTKTGTVPSTSPSEPSGPVDRANEIEFCGRTWPLDATEVVCRDPSVSDLELLGRLTQLRVLSLDGTAVANLQPLAACAALEDLSVRGTRVTSVRALEGLSELIALDVHGTKVDLTEFRGLTQLGVLRASVSGEDLNFVKGMKLFELVVDSDTVTDISGLRGHEFGILILSLPALRDASPLATTRAAVLTLDVPNIDDVEPLLHVEGLEQLELRTGADLEPLAACEVEGVQTMSLQSLRPVSEELRLELQTCAELFTLTAI